MIKLRSKAFVLMLGVSAISYLFNCTLATALKTNLGGRRMGDAA